MDCEFTEDQILLRESVRRLVAREFPFGRCQTPVREPCGYSGSVWRQFAGLGLLGLGLSERVGGRGGPLEIMLVMEELGRGLVPEPFVSTVVLCGGLIQEYGTVAQRARLLPRIVAGDCRMALAHHEAGARYVLDYVGTIARRGRGCYVLNGCKASIADAHAADPLIVTARDDAAGGLSLFLVEPGATGVRMSEYRTQDGRPAADIELADVKVPTVARIGAPGVALTALELALDCSLAALCAEAVGVMEALNERALQSLNMRKQLDVPPARMQFWQRLMVDMFLLATQAKSLSFLATGRCRELDRCVRRRGLAAARAFVSKAALRVAQQAVELDGGEAAAAVDRYCNRLVQIDATLGGFEHPSGTFRHLLRVES